MSDKIKWYNETTYKMTMIAMAAISSSFTVGVWIVDGEIADFSALITFGSIMVVTTILQYLYRNRE